ncbi:FabD/lysophospholipase-like protein [Colletotrichum somersetense]|nr:FabD/lysophospholipase-like protein [Colletotrichum somersetense]
MTSTHAQITGGEPNPVERTGLCLLSLDGGGVRGLSTLFILKGIMNRLNHERERTGLPSVKPCEVFDMIGGTSTGGLIAIMLGRLEMDVDECIAAYTELIKEIFSEKLHKFRVGMSFKIRPRFDSKKLCNAIEAVLKKKGMPVTTLLNDGEERGCKVFVCAASKEVSDIVCLRSYRNAARAPEHTPVTIIQAALATSAATGLFDPVTIGARKYVDGALGANNPVDQMEAEASDVWCSRSGDLQSLVKCLISLGTGKPGKKGIQDRLDKFVSETLVKITTETEATATKFMKRWRKHYDTERYFRFNVEQGLQEVDVAEYEAQGQIEAATESYFNEQAQSSQVRKCVANLKEKQKPADNMLEEVYTKWHNNLRLDLGTRQKPHFIVPFGRNENFVGRDAIMTQLLERIPPSAYKDTCQRTAIVGLGGIGKTQVAIEAAYRVRDAHPDCSVFWVPAVTTVMFENAYREIGRALGIRDVEDDQADVKSLVKAALESDDAGNWLLIVDNADDIDLLFTRSRLITYLPSNRKGSILLTTRNHQAAARFSQGRPMHLHEMDSMEATQLLCTGLDESQMSDAQSRTQLLEHLTYLPLAIRQASAYMAANMSVTVSKYLEYCKASDERLMKLLSKDFEDQDRYEAIRNPVATTWLISFLHISRDNPLAAKYLSFMCYLGEKDIPRALLPSEGDGKDTDDEMEVGEAISTLMAYAFVQKRDAVDRFDIHRLVRLVMRNWLREQGREKEQVTETIYWLYKRFPWPDHGNREVWMAYLPHAQAALQVGDWCTDNEALWDLLSSVGQSNNLLGKYGAAEQMHRQTLELRKKVLGLENPDTLASMNNLAEVFRSQGRSEEAEEMHRQTLELMEKVLGLENPDTLTSMNNLAHTHQHEQPGKCA